MKLPMHLPLLLLLAALPVRGLEEPKLLAVRDLSGKHCDPFMTSAETVVLIFVNVDCPISNKQAPEVNRLHKAYSGDNTAFWLVYPDANVTSREISDHLKAYGYSCPALLDPKHELVKRTGVTVTPEAAVFHKKELVYRGRIDDRHPALGVTRKEATSHDLQKILDALAEGQSVTFRSTPAVGCYIEAGAER